MFPPFEDIYVEAMSKRKITPLAYKVNDYHSSFYTVYNRMLDILGSIESSIPLKPANEAEMLKYNKAKIRMYQTKIDHLRLLKDYFKTYSNYIDVEIKRLKEHKQELANGTMENATGR